MRIFPCLCLIAALLLPQAQAQGTEAPVLQGGETPITRGDFALLLWQSAGGTSYDVSALPFSDVPKDDDCAQAVCWAYDLGLTQGVGEGRFAPDRPLTREEWATLLRREDARQGRDTWFPDAGICNDFQDISPWADDSLYWACSTSRIGWKDDRLAPLAPVTEAEAAASLSPNAPG